MKSPEIPSVTILDAIKPVQPDADVLSYDKLRPAVEKHRPFEYTRISRVWAEEDTLREEAAAREAANQYLLMTAQRLQEVGEPEKVKLWSERYTQASVELFGAPRIEVVVPLLAEEFATLESLEGNASVDQELLGFVMESYRNVLADISTQEAAENVEKREAVRTAAEKIGEVITNRFPDVMAIFDGDDEEVLRPAQIAGRFDAALTKLKEQDLRWEKYAIDRTDDTKLIAVAGKMKVTVGQNRASSTLRETKGLFAHEVLLHCLRAVNAPDKTSAKGLPGYLDAEEGTGTFFEYAITGVIPPKNIDRYGDIGLALGTVNGKGMARKELNDLAFARAIIREQAARKSEIDISDLSTKTREHVNRIYRGSRGDEYVGVFTKDIAYHKGFVEIADFVVEQLRIGKSAEEIFDLLVCAKIDPTNKLHVEYVESARAAISTQS